MKAVFKKTALVCVGIYAAIALLILLQNDRDSVSMVGLTGLLLGVLFFGIGIIVCIPTTSRPVGQALLLCAGIIFLIGVSVCSVFQPNMNFH